MLDSLIMSSIMMKVSPLDSMMTNPNASFISFDLNNTITIGSLFHEQRTLPEIGIVDQEVYRK